jgi:hypothetical protein
MRNSRMAPYGALFARRRVMRNTVVLALLAIATLSFMGCSDDSSGGDIGLRRTQKPPPAAGTPAEHDDGDTEGENQNDPQNPNADTTPPRPDGTGTSTGSFGMTLTNNTPAVDLGEKVELDINIEAKNGFKGDVDVTATGLPAGATAAPLKISVTGATATGKLAINAALTAVPNAAGTSSALTITAKSGTATATAPANFKINPRVKLTIPLNIDALRAAQTTYRDEWGTAFGATPTPLKTQTGNPISFVVFNADSKQHIIHGQNGFAHGSTTAGQEIKPNSYELTNGTMRVRNLNPGVNASGYPHEGANGPGASFRIQIQAAN